MQSWGSHLVASYQTSLGTLVYEEEGNVPKPERFQAQLDLLFRLAQIIEQKSIVSGKDHD